MKSVLADTSIRKKEIIVVDNGSKDGSVETIEKLINKKAIKLIKNNENLGFSKANNQGNRVAKGKYILLLNSDTLIQKGSLKKLIDFAQKHQDAGVVAARLLNKDGSLQSSCFNLPTIIRAVKQYWFHNGSPLDKFAPSTSDPVEVEAVVGAAMLITPKAIQKVGTLDERYFFYYEDLAYCRELKRVGLKVYYLPSVEVLHYHGVSGHGLTDTQNQWRRLIPSSKIYHGIVKHYIFNFILWSGQKVDALLGQSH